MNLIICAVVSQKSLKNRKKCIMNNGPYSQLRVRGTVVEIA